MDRFVQAALDQQAQAQTQGQSAPVSSATPPPAAPAATTPWSSPASNPGTAPPWLQSSPPPAAPMPQSGEMTSGLHPYTPSAPTYGDAQSFGTRPMQTGQSYAGTGEANPGVQMGQQAPWQGGPNVTLTRAGTGGVPGLAGGLNTSGMPELAQGLDTSGFTDFDQDFAGAGDRAARQAYEGMTQFMDEDFGQDSAALQTQLVNQGLQPGSEAYQREMSLQMRGQNAARQQAAAQAGQIGHQRSGDLLARALETRRLQGSEAGQDAATRLASRGMLGQEAGQDAATRLASRGALMGERERDADRLNAQSMGVANLGLAARGQDMGLQQAAANAAGAGAAANAAREASRYSTDTSRDLALRGYGLQQDSQEFSQLMQLIAASRGGVNMPNFGGATPLDVGNAYGIASNNNNAQQNRDAQDRAGYAGLGAAALGAAGNYFARNNNGY